MSGYWGVDCTLVSIMAGAKHVCYDGIVRNDGDWSVRVMVVSSIDKSSLWKWSESYILFSCMSYMNIFNSNREACLESSMTTWVLTFRGCIIMVFWECLLQTRFSGQVVKNRNTVPHGAFESIRDLVYYMRSTSSILQTWPPKANVVIMIINNLPNRNRNLTKLPSYIELKQLLSRTNNLDVPRVRN